MGYKTQNTATTTQTLENKKVSFTALGPGWVPNLEDLFYSTMSE